MIRLKLILSLGLILVVSCSVAADELLVSAAASLTNAFKSIGVEFERAHQRDTVVFNFAASDVLVKQIAEGAPVDVFASADQEAMDKADKANLIVAGTRFNFVGNRLVLAVPIDSPLRFTALEELNGKSVRRIAISQAATVPVGRYTKAVLDKARLWHPLQDRFIYTQNVRQTLDYLARGEVDAGFVYSTDAQLMKARVRVALEITTTQPVTYPIGVVAASKNIRLARQFVDLVNSSTGQTILQQFGFTKP
ncbi:MAG TPA: molybdate ABC transporter substrate-binding protein [Candidatus Limnocylindrales bacterium]|nr:molybdate ABC transporter substrate-binding protein [Candidatus Limnocylindrales bacterium]